jgi:hypothetical protein
MQITRFLAGPWSLGHLHGDGSAGIKILGEERLLETATIVVGMREMFDGFPCINKALYRSEQRVVQWRHYTMAS